MLVLSRKLGEKIVIGDGITLTVVGVIGNRVRIGIDAPEDVSILRAELAGWRDELIDPDLQGKPEWSEGAEKQVELVSLSVAR